MLAVRQGRRNSIRLMLCAPGVSNSAALGCQWMQRQYLLDAGAHLACRMNCGVSSCSTGALFGTGCWHLASPLWGSGLSVAASRVGGHLAVSCRGSVLTSLCEHLIRSVWRSWLFGGVRLASSWSIVFGCQWRRQWMPWWRWRAWLVGKIGQLGWRRKRGGTMITRTGVSISWGYCGASSAERHCGVCALNVVSPLRDICFCHSGQAAGAPHRLNPDDRFIVSPWGFICYSL